MRCTLIQTIRFLPYYWENVVTGTKTFKADGKDNPVGGNGDLPKIVLATGWSTKTLM